MKENILVVLIAFLIIIGFSIGEAYLFTFLWNFVGHTFTFMPVIGVKTAFCIIVLLNFFFKSHKNNTK